MKNNTNNKNGVGVGIGMLTGIIIWIYALFSWGLLLGLIFGWIPAIIGGFILGFIRRVISSHR